jgi:gliding motility-associated lipoprotein GldK
MDEALPQRNKFDVATSTYPPGSTARVDTFWVNENGEIKDSTIIRPLKEPKDLLTNRIICIYPDTLVWARDFQFSYNDPLLQMYFKHPGYAEYPVVGVTWEQAHAFCNWRSKLFNSYSTTEANDYRLPTEAQWEYAARGGRKMAMYPWGSNYARDAKGCFFANFKPYRGAYNDDTGTTTMRVAQFRPNDFGLYDMGGNVAEWTNSAFQSYMNTHVHDLNPDYTYMARKADPDILKRKVVKGGSWKDISYFMQCGVRTYEYQYESRPYIGFRCVRAYIGD